ncbi:hypothetical protein BROUX41_000753 [Berkeleyomyces rouxiae]|uniref:uncharacterized protein n=1 Tax=Berkeleyomyces rouxiae TaxID=2035830 RepID=UPI003B765DAC
MAEKLIFFDLPTKAPQKGWSLNPWRTRLILNYKGIDYGTEWVEYPDIKSRLEGHVTPFTGPPYLEPTYTIPAVKFPDGSYMIDSLQIADEIERRYPSHPLQLDAPVLSRLKPLVDQICGALMPIFIPAIPQVYLGPESVDYWNRTRTQICGGVTPTELGKAHGGAKAWAAAAPHIASVTELFKETDGPFFLGAQVSYADFVWVSLLIFFKGLGDEEWRELLKASGDAGPHERILEACKEWTARDD